MFKFRLDVAVARLVPAALLAVSVGAAQPSGVMPVDAGAYRQHLATLASDEFEGRKPGSAGEQKTLDYLVAQFKQLGLKPGNGASYLQPVPMVEITTAQDASLSFSHGSTRRDLKYTDEMVVWTKRVQPQAAIVDSALVFVGHGVTAPEYGWDDYAGIDMRGKTAVILINDPGFATNDASLFRGRAMTYYGRWTYKYEEAARRGASGALIVHETDAAAYGWETVVNSWGGPQLDKETADGNAGRPAIEGWITLAAAEQLFAANGTTFAAAKARANTRGFKAEQLNSTASAAVRNGIRRASSHNVAAVLPGRLRASEYVLYMAHWDHLGKTLPRAGDTIFNGAVDNATGTAGLLAIAAAYAKAKKKPERSVVFLGVTLEESGLLGSAYYVDNPLFPLAQTVAAINMDALPFGGPTRDVTVIGFGASELERYLQAAAKRQGRVLKEEPTPEKGFFYRSDHFNFAKGGVPALYVKLGIDDRLKGPIWGQAQLDEFVAQRYHKVGDEYSPTVDVSGAVEDLNLLYAVGAQLAREKHFPNWYPNNEFRATRDRSRAIMGK
jgi:Zn-dependent M28 family amino/carboxypeptidase